MGPEDIPHKKKSCAALLVNMVKEHGIDLAKIQWTYTGDEFKAEDISWFYRDMLEEVEKQADAEGIKDKVSAAVASLTALAKAFKDHHKC